VTTTGQGLATTIRAWFAIDDANSPFERALLCEQFRRLATQAPVLYGVLVLDSISIAIVTPANLPWWLRFVFPGLLLTACIYRMTHWVRLRGYVPTPELARVQLVKGRALTAILSIGFLIWTSALLFTVDAELRAPIALVIFAASAISAYCLASLPSAARLNLLISGLPIALLLVLSGDTMLAWIGANLAMIQALLVRMLNADFAGMVELVASHAKLEDESARARAAETVTRGAQARAETIAARFDTALNNMSQGLCFFDGTQRLIVSNRQYREIYELSAEDVRPGLLLKDIVDLRYKAGTSPKAMTQDDYLRWRISPIINNQASDSIVELANDRVVRICHRPMPDGGWVATHEDITERHQTELALNAAKADAERAELMARAAHARLVEALDVVSEGLAIYDKDDRLVLWNRQYADVYPMSKDVMTSGATFEDILRTGLDRGQYPEALGHEERWLRTRIARHLQDHSSHEQQLPGDRWVRIEERRTGDGGVIGVRIDITDLKRREASFRLLFEENPLPMWVADSATGRFLAVNVAMCSHYGYSGEQLLAMSEGDLQVSSEDASPAANAAPPDDEGAQLCRHRTENGRVIELVVESRALRYHGADAHVSVAFDMTERNQVEQRIRYLACHDGLTDLPNRVALEEHMSGARERARANDSGFAVLCIDLDRFKQINDLYGHAMGDQVLRMVTRRLVDSGPEAFLARVGGDEFVAITEQQPLLGAAELLAARLRDALEDRIEIAGHSFDLNLSIGIAVYPKDGQDQITLLANADAALYRAKHEGRGTIRFFTAAMDQQQRERSALENDLRSAVANGQLYLEYQPQRSRDGRIIGFEALARWNHPARGLVPPSEFIPLAEESGLIVSIGEWVLREACREAASWDRELQIAVNVSAVQFRRDNLEALVGRVLQETGVAATRLELEITEGVLIENVTHTSAILNQLKSLGVRIALDDFGTGYSSLSYLEALPLDRVKIDRSFVSALGRTERSLAIVRAVIGLAHGLDLPVLAEGVETSEQLAALVKEGCDEMQGFLIGRPHPISHYRDIVDGALSDKAARSA